MINQKDWKSTPVTASVKMGQQIIEINNFFPGDNLSEKNAFEEETLLELNYENFPLFDICLKKERHLPQELLSDIQKTVWFLSNARRKDDLPFVATYPDGQLLAFNQPFQKLIGYSKEELSKLNISHITTASSYDIEVVKREEVDQTGQIQTFEKEFLTRDGKVINIEVQLHKITAGNLKFFYTSFDNQDVKNLPDDSLQSSKTLQTLIDTIYETQEALAASEERYHSIGELITYGVWTTDRDGKTTYLSESFLELLGMTLDESIECGWMHLLAPETMAKALLDWQECVKNERSWDYEYKFITKDGLCKYILSRGVPLRDNKNVITGWVGINLDITERKQMEEELRAHHNHLEELVEERTLELQWVNKQLQQEIEERRQVEENLRYSEERFSKAFYASKAMMSITSYCDGRYLDVNESFLRVTGYSREEVITKTVEELNLWIFPGGRNLFKQLINEIEKFKNKEVKFRTKSGEERFSLVSADIITINGEKCILSEANDITELKRMQKEIAHLDRLNLVGELAAGIGHEIRNPMTTVRGFLQMLGAKEDYKNDKRFFDLMIEELDRANTIIREFLSMAKDKEMELAILNLNDILEAVYPLIQADALLNSKVVTLDLGYVEKLSLDEKEIRQLILNLVRNGLESMGPGGKLLISTYIEKGDVVLAVKDEGKGISPEIMDKLGTPFMTTKETGTGLGLAVCYSIATRHDAAIKVETGERGTTFYVRFKT